MRGAGETCNHAGSVFRHQDHLPRAGVVNDHHQAGLVVVRAMCGTPWGIRSVSPAFIASQRSPRRCRQEPESTCRYPRCWGGCAAGWTGSARCARFPRSISAARVELGIHQPADPAPGELLRLDLFIGLETDLHGGPSACAVCPVRTAVPAAKAAPERKSRRPIVVISYSGSN